MTSYSPAVELLRDLIRIPSQNPGNTERKVAEFIAEYFKQIGVLTTFIEYKPERTNVLCEIASKNRKARVLLSPHIDTVPAGEGWCCDPFAAEIKNGKLYGRGAADCKVNAAVAMDVIRRLKAGEFALENIDLVFAASSEEETGSAIGFIPLIKDIPFCQYALIMDGEAFEIGYAQKGVVHMEVTALGKKAHGAYPEEGINAADRVIAFYEEAKKFVAAANKKSKQVQMTLNLGVLKGGNKVNMVPDECMAALDFRFLPPMSIKEVRATLKAIAKKLGGKFTFNELNSQQPACYPKDGKLAASMKAAIVKNKKKVVYRLFKGATVLNYTHKGCEALIIGFADAGVFHKTDEYVPVKSVDQGVSVVRDILLELDKKV